MQFKDDLREQVERMCEETGITRTAAAERALRMYLKHYEETGGT